MDKYQVDIQNLTNKQSVTISLTNSQKTQLLAMERNATDKYQVVLQNTTKKESVFIPLIPTQITALLTMLGGTPPPPTVQPTGVAGNWELAFQDEFLQSSLDASKWTANWLGAEGAITPPVNSSEDAYYDPTQVSLGNGELLLTAQTKSAVINGTWYTYASGMIQSNGKLALTEGSFLEARIQTPGNIGSWPAFWTNGSNWPTTGEIDIMEQWDNGDPEYHYHYNSGGGNDPGPGGSAPVSGSPSGGFHTYGVNWQAGVITWYYDGVQVWKQTNADLQNAQITSSPQYIILNLALASTPANLPAIMQVDYVRMWTGA